MKKLSTQLTIALFLGIPPDEQEADEVSELMTTHWRGLGSNKCHLLSHVYQVWCPFLLVSDYLDHGGDQHIIRLCLLKMN